MIRQYLINTKLYAYLCLAIFAGVGLCAQQVVPVTLQSQKLEPIRCGTCLQGSTHSIVTTADLSPLAEVDESKTTVLDYMVVFDRSAQLYMSDKGGAEIFAAKIVTSVNEVFRNSDINAELRLAHIMLLDEEIPSVHQGLNIQSSPSVQEMRRKYKADLVTVCSNPFYDGLSGKNKVGDMGDLDIIGDTTPRYQYSVNGSISYKGLSLSFMLQGVGKRDWNPGGAAYFWGSGAYAQVTVFKEHLDYWREDNPGAYYPKPYIHGVGAIGSFQSKTRQTSDRYLQNAAYCRLKNLTLSYDIPQMWVNKLGINGLQVFFSGENLLTLTSLKTMFDPEVIFATSGYSADKNYPMNRVLSCGLTVNL